MNTVKVNRTKIWRDKNRAYWSSRDAWIEVPKKRCFGCKKQKQGIQFYKAPHNLDGLQSRCIKCYRDYYHKNLIKHMLYNAKCRAKQLNIEFQLSESDVQIPEVCPVLGIKLETGDKQRHNASPSIDRWDNAKGYIPENIVIISWRANNLKRDASIEELECVLKYMRHPQGDQNL